MFYLGLDIGSLSCDAVIIDSQGQIVSSTVVPTGARNMEAIQRAQKEALQQAEIQEDDICSMVSTGYGRERVDGRQAAVTEITCHARGIGVLFPQTRLLIDIGGQDSKVIRLNQGKVEDFAMNDKCAAGTGRFLEAMARALQVDIDQMSTMAKGANGGVNISSMCTVFAESEVVSLIAEGMEEREIVWGLNRAIASRTVSLVKRVSPVIKGLPLSMSGGVAKNRGVVEAIGNLLEVNIFLPPEPDIVGALGAALIARERYGG